MSQTVHWLNAFGGNTMLTVNEVGRQLTFKLTNTAASGAGFAADGKGGTLITCTNARAVGLSDVISPSAALSAPLTLTDLFPSSGALSFDLPVAMGGIINDAPSPTGGFIASLSESQIAQIVGHPFA